jgi:hypothetical protein
LDADDGVRVGEEGGVEGVVHFVDVGDVELFGPVGDVGGDLGVDLFGVAGGEISN